MIVACSDCGAFQRLPPAQGRGKLVCCLDETANQTIAHGIGELLSAGLWPLAMVIFCTSIAIPLLNLCGMSGMPAFLAVIVLTMLAARWFDARLMWDNGRRAA